MLKRMEIILNCIIHGMLILTFIRGDSHIGIGLQCKNQGSLDVVENWRTHWKVGGGEFRGTPASNPNGIEN